MEGGDARTKPRNNNRDRKHNRGGRGVSGGRGRGRGSGSDGGRGDEPKKFRTNSPAAVPDLNANRSAAAGDSRYNKNAAAPVNGGGQDFKSRTSSTTRSQLTTEAFASLNIDPYVKQAIKETLKYEFMTKVQAQTLPTTLAKTNVIAKAKTGTGKTISFLLPAIETALANNSTGNKKSTSALILSPTRELAQQIEEEAVSLLSKLPGRQRLTTASFVGGVKISKDFSKLKRGPIDILVATPGRMIDHLENQGLDLSQLETLIFDEADQLLDMGFRPSIERILHALPRRKRQVLLFSATLPQSVEQIAQLALGESKGPRGGGGAKSDMTLIDTVGQEESTHKHIPQYVQSITLENGVSRLYRLLDQHVREVPSYKVMIFFATARQTQLYAEVFSSLLPKNSVLEMHSRKSQGYRNKVADQFRLSTGGHVMFSSDVSARGMDYPDVTMVVQFGLPDSPDQYTHRVGRTGRGDSTVAGTGHLMLHDFEERSFMRNMNQAKLPIETIASPLPAVPGEDEAIRNAIRGMDKLTLTTAYQASLGYYLGKIKRLDIRDREEMVAIMNEWICKTFQFGDEPPALLARTVGKMNLKGCPGVRIDRSPASSDGGGGGGGGRRGGGGGRGGRGGGNSRGGGRGGGRR